MCGQEGFASEKTLQQGYHIEPQRELLFFALPIDIFLRVACWIETGFLFILFFSLNLSLQSESIVLFSTIPFCKLIACTVSPATETSDVQTLLQN